MPPRPKTGPIDMAEAWIIQNPTATYRDAAMLFGLTHNNVRARISNKYGSLTEARLTGPSLVNRDPKRAMKAIRRCLRCGTSASIEQGRRMCVCCAKEVAGLHDGSV